MNANELSVINFDAVYANQLIFTGDSGDEGRPLLDYQSISRRRSDKLKMPRVIPVDILAATFGIGSWIAVNGLWVELPLLVQELPEGWSLPSYLSIIIQIANLGPLLYGVLSRAAPHIIKPSRAIWVVLVLGVIAASLLPPFWDETALMFGEEHSVALFVLSLALSLVDCTSSVLFLPYIGLFRSVYLPSYLMGEGLSALLPSLVAVAQGVGKSQCVNSTDPENPGLVEVLDPPRFSTEIFFVTLAVMMAISALAFTGLEFLPICQNERVSESETENKHQESPSLLTTKHGIQALWFLLALQCWMSFWANGVLISLQTYSCLPYGNGAYHWAAILYNVANPLACLLALYRPLRALNGLGSLVGFASFVSAYLLWTAGTSPSPPLVGTSAGAPIVVAAWFAYSALTSYAKVSVACVLRQNTWERHANYDASAPRTEAESRLFKYGVATQSGSLIGSIITFVLVNVIEVFTAAYPCSS